MAKTKPSKIASATERFAATVCFEANLWLVADKLPEILLPKFLSGEILSQ